MSKTDKYINPFTDFGFKKLFGEEDNKDLLIDFLVADIANLSKEEHSNYISSLKYYRDMKNVTDTAFQDGEIKGEIKGKAETTLKNVQKAIKRGKLTDAEIAEDFDVTIEYVQQIRKTSHENH
jgi:predicted transposase YdaD